MYFIQMLQGSSFLIMTYLLRRDYNIQPKKELKLRLGGRRYMDPLGMISPILVRGAPVQSEVRRVQAYLSDNVQGYLHIPRGSIFLRNYEYGLGQVLLICGLGPRVSI